MRRLVRAAVIAATAAVTALSAVAGCAASTAGAAGQAAAAGIPSPNRAVPTPPPFDLQAHRGGAALTVENTLAAFGRALDLGVSTLELDTQITEDGRAVVTHDRDPDPRKCTDTSPATPGDPEYPYVPGTRYIKDLTLAQVRTLDCGSTSLAEFPEQQASPGARMPLLSEVLDLVQQRGADDVVLNLELKVEAASPTETAPRDQFVDVVTRDVRDAGMLGQVTIESFDWGALMRVRQVQPDLPIIALTNGRPFLQTGLPGASPWLGGIDIDDFGGDVVAAAHSFGADALSPVHGCPADGGVDDPGYVPFTTAPMVRSAHAAGMTVIPWTVDDAATMQSLIDMGVDGIITNHPDVLRDVLADDGFPLPPAHPAR
ncbi:MAG TPA: glycerophosphodiester phosphodiesterase family protein [Modestobacter sp.]|jgi:glycerophosphoryl diester phosphodiesterase|nr:glycerophosphodiester phosphodiesterase family protein [Modestobacter sp.]